MPSSTTRLPTDKVKVTLSEKPESPEILAEAIVKMSDGFDKLMASGLNRKAIVVLLADASKVSRGDINAVLDALRDLRRDYCR